MRTIRDVMSDEVIMFPIHATIADAARVMRDNGVGDVIVANDGRFLGLLTDRDIIVRSIAEGCDPTTTQVGDAMSRDVAALTPNCTVDEAVALMREHALLRIPVVKGGDIPVGMVSIGDLAMAEDPTLRSRI